MEGIENLYVGIDLGDQHTMVSFAYQKNSEPETVSPMAGSEIFQIPTAVAFRTGDHTFVYGEEARRIAKAGLGNCEGALLTRALNGEQIVFDSKDYSAVTLLAMFLKKMIQMAGRLGPKAHLSHLVICVEALDARMVQLLRDVTDAMELETGSVHFMDYKESFYFYGIHQPPELSSHAIALFQYSGQQMKYWCLLQELPSKPPVYTVREKQFSFEGSSRDELFARLIPQCFEKQIITTVYLVGENFDGDWMKQSLRLICQGRRAFLGKNLFSKGACFAAMDMDGGRPGGSVYMGDHEMKYNVSLKVYERGNISFYTLVNAGEPWFEAGGSCELIIDGKPTVDFWIQLPHSREAKIESLELRDLPKRENRTTRILVEAKPGSDQIVNIRITDLGFGELAPGTMQQWQYTIRG